MKIKLQEILDSKNISVYSLSKQIGVTQNNLGKLIKGETTSIKYDILEKLCNILDITPNDIFEIEPLTDIEIKTYKILNKIKDDKITSYYDYNSNFRLSDIERFIPQTTETTQPDIQTIDSKGNVNLYEVKSSNSANKPYRLSGHQALKNAEQFEKQHDYDPIPTDEEYYEINKMEDRFNMEYDIANNLFMIIDNIIYNTDTSEFSDIFKSNIETYKKLKNSIEASKFILVYPILYVSIVKQFKDKQLLNFMIRMRKVYSNGLFLEISDDEIRKLLDESTYLRNKTSEYNIKQKD